ncbi:hypothetical protein QTP88_009143 [Uroleucon formosanum]
MGPHTIFFVCRWLGYDVLNLLVRETNRYESILKSLIQKSEISQISQGENHKLVTCKRGRCCECYNEMVKQGGRKHAKKVTRKVQTMCTSCSKPLCLDSFFTTHSSKKIKY